jgi:hypothetical protein
LAWAIPTPPAVPALNARVAAATISLRIMRVPPWG